MSGKDTFSAYHPLVNFLYFAWVIGFTMFLMHPISLTISLAAALVCAVDLNGGRAVRSALRWLLPVALAAAVLNPAFNHEGATILTYLPSGNPLTLESIAYGVSAAVMLSAVVVWFSCCSAVMTGDKLVYLFGRAAPALSLLLSMTLRFIPKCREQLREVWEAQRCAGGEQGRTQRLKEAVTVLSITVTWSLEDAIETADSMKSRGYGLPGRSAFSIYRLRGRDKAALGWLLACGLYLVAGGLAGDMDWRYYPTVKGAALGTRSVSLQLVYLALCLTPVFLHVWEARKWRGEP